jgi:transcriptional regulator with PAS, ATPase and Fis domain
MSHWETNPLQISRLLAVRNNPLLNPVGRSLIPNSSFSRVASADQFVKTLSGRTCRFGMDESTGGEAQFTPPSGECPKLLTTNNRTMQAVLKDLSLVAPMPSPVLILGQTGTGKDVIANAIHEQSPRAAKPFVAVNCGALSEHLIESELFGHAANAFTGSGPKEKKGLLEAANGGTLFLDELGDAPMSVQTKLLRFLETGEFLPVQSTTPKKVDVRVIAATHRNLQDAVRNKSFREDLYYRLKVFPLHLPSLKDRPEDIEPLARHLLTDRFLYLIKANHKFKSASGFTPEAMALLKDYHWPGNIRELKNVIESALIRANGEELITPEHLKPNMTFLNRDPLPTHINAEHQFCEANNRDSFRNWDDVYVSYLKAAIAFCSNNIPKVAAGSGIGTYKIYSDIKALKLREFVDGLSSQPSYTVPKGSEFFDTERPPFQLKPMKDVKRNYLDVVLRSTGSNQRAASRIIGITPNTIGKWIRELKHTEQPGDPAAETTG